MTDKITKKDAETLALEAGIKAGFDYARKASNQEKDASEAIIHGKTVFYETFAQIRPRIIPESPWQPIGKCPRFSGKRYDLLARERAGKGMFRLVDCRYGPDGSVWFDMAGRKVSLIYEILGYMEIPTLPDEVA